MARMTLGFLFVFALLASPAFGGDCEGCHASMFGGWTCSDTCDGKSGNDDCDIVWSGGWHWCELNGWSCTGSANCPSGSCIVQDMCEPENKGAVLIVPNGEATSLAWMSPEATGSDQPECEA